MKRVFKSEYYELPSKYNKTTISNVSAVTIVKKYLANDTIKAETKDAATALYYYYQAAIAYLREN